MGNKYPTEEEQTLESIDAVWSRIESLAEEMKELNITMLRVATALEKLTESK